MEAWSSLDPFLSRDIGLIAKSKSLNPASAWAEWYGAAGEKSGQYPWQIATIPTNYVINAIIQNGQNQSATLRLDIATSPEARVFEVLRYNSQEGQQTSGWRSFRQILLGNTFEFTITVGDGEGNLWIVFEHSGTFPNITFARPAFKDVEA